MLLNLVPVVLRINVHIIDMDKQSQDLDSNAFCVSYNNAQVNTFRFKVIGDSLNLHSETLQVMRKEGHYDALYNQSRWTDGI